MKQKIQDYDLLAEDPGADAMMQQMSTGNLSALESISQFGSMSQTGSGEPSVKLGETRSLPEPPKKVGHLNPRFFAIELSDGLESARSDMTNNELLESVWVPI